MTKSLKEWKREIDRKIDIARNEYIDGKYHVLDENYIEELSNRAKNRILKNNIKIGVTM